MTTLVPMTESEYRAFAGTTVPAYAAEKVASGEWAQEDAIERAKKALATQLPQGLQSVGNHLYTIRDTPSSEPVGVLWIAVQERAGRRIAYVYDVSIDSRYRRRGYASRAFVALEDEVRKLGLSGISLHVFGHNHAAQALYAKLGYQPTNITLFKPIGPATG
jgi:ribosomal protein S18 acetylase RimI-like enzyme